MNHLTPFQDSFSGPFKSRERADATWGPRRDDHSHFECADPSAGEQLTVSSRQYQMVDGAVQQVGGSLAPIYAVRRLFDVQLEEGDEELLSERSNSDISAQAALSKGDKASAIRGLGRDERVVHVNGW